jgi:hypothetical protein
MARKKKAKSYPDHCISTQQIEDLAHALASSTDSIHPLSGFQNITHQAYIQEGLLVLVSTFLIANPEAHRQNINKANFDSNGYVCRSPEGLTIKTAAPFPDQKYRDQVFAQASAHNDTIKRLLRLVLA